MTPSIIIIGGGMAGVASAWFLAQSGARVLLLEQGNTFGWLTTGASLQAVRAQFSDPVNIAFMSESLAYYEHLGEHLDLPGYDIGFHQQGYLFITSEEAAIPALQERVAFQHSHGLTDVEFLAQAELRHRFPFLAPAALAATFRQRDGWLSAHEALDGFRRAARRLDDGRRAEFRLNTRVEGLVQAGGRVTGVVTGEGNLEADAIVIACGPFSREVALMAGAELAIEAVRRHRLVIGEHHLIPGWAPMTIDQDTGAHWRPEGPGAALAWAEPEPATPPSLDVRPDPNFPFRVLEGVYRLCPFWGDVAETLPRSQVFLHAGQYDMTPDHNPLIGPVPGIEGLWVNAGYSGHGVMAAPGGAKLLADLLTGARPLADNPFAPDRPFAHGDETENMVI